jgi:uracil phosphoribosyltransferase
MDIRTQEQYNVLRKRKGGNAMGNVYVFDHPLIQHKLTHIRDKRTGTKEFRELVEEVAALMAYEITRDMPLREVTVETPVAPARCKVLAGKKLGLVPILRAGLGMVDGILRLIPTAKVGHIGLYRDPETLEPVQYYAKMPSDIEERDLIVIDPMLATGGSAAAAIRLIKEMGGRSIKLMCLIAAPEGIRRVHEEHDDVDIYAAAVDERLNEKSYIVPGLGDAGDRLFGTR